MNELQVIERENQRVMTTAVLADEYGTTEKVISNNFNRNKERYIKGKHFYCLEGEEKREFLNLHQIEDGSKNATRIYLWTEKGALFHAKSLGTDRAWEVYDELVENYFRKDSNNAILQNMSTEMKGVILLDRKLQAVESDIKKVDKELQDFKMDVPLFAVECDRITQAVRRKGVGCLGGKESIAYHDKPLRSKVYADIYREVKRQFGISSYKAIKRGQCDLAVDVVNNYELPLVLKEEVENCNRQGCLA